MINHQYYYYGSEDEPYSYGTSPKGPLWLGIQASKEYGAHSKEREGTLLGYTERREQSLEKKN